jgi:crossover junction endodeoxyribonuclease RuvC
MPTLPTTTGRRQLDPAALAEILKRHNPTFVLVERVGPRPGEGASSAFAFGWVFGGMLATLCTLAIPHATINPATWKRRAGIPPRALKCISIVTAKAALPEAAPHLSRVKDDGRAEALLLAIQCWQSRTATPQ